MSTKAPHCLSQRSIVCGVSYERPHFLALLHWTWSHIGVEDIRRRHISFSGGLLKRPVLHSLCRLFPQLTPWMPTARKITEAKCLWKEVCYQPTSKQTIKNSSPQTISYERRYKRCSSPPPPSTKLIIIFCAKPWSSSPMCCSSHKPLLYHLNLEKKKKQHSLDRHSQRK